MGANEKHAATYHGREYTPSTDDLREIWVDRQLDHLPSEEGIRRVPETQAAFDRWLETVRAEAKAEALLGLASELESDPVKGDTFFTKLIQPSCNVFAMWLLRARANQYKEGADNGR